MNKQISRNVKRFIMPDSYFGKQDRCVPVVMEKHSKDSLPYEWAILIEEYIAEQLDYRVEGDLLILNDDRDLKFDETLGLIIPDSYDKDPVRETSDIPIYSYNSFLSWSKGAKDNELIRHEECESDDVVLVHNEGGNIMWSNFWDTGIENEGLFYLTINAGVFRLLVPEKHEADIEEIKTGKYAVITPGPNQSVMGRMMCEIMFDDHSDQPFALWLSMNQLDRAISYSDGNIRERSLHVYTKGCKEVMSMKCYLRGEHPLPCLKQLNNNHGNN